MVVDWIDFYEESVKEGWKPDRTITKIRDSIGDVFGPKYGDEVKKRLIYYKKTCSDVYNRYGGIMPKYEKIEFASQVLVEQYEEIADHFIPAVFGIKRFLLTDESCLDDFNFEVVDEKVQRDREQTFKKIKEIYDVDVSDLDYLTEIFKRLRILSPVFN